jgi:hypothetical protein
LGELGAELGVSQKRAHDLVHQLAHKQMIEHESGKTRGIRLIDRGEELSEADVLLRLSAMGWTIGRGGAMVLPPHNELGATLVQGLTDKGLHALPILDHKPASGTGVGNSGRKGKGGARERHAGASEDARRSAGG